MLLSLFAWGEPVRSEEQNKIPAGKYYVETFMGDKDSIDTIEFLPDGKCIIDLGDGAGGLSGSYHGISDGRLTLEYGNPKIVRSFKAALEKRTLTLTEGDHLEASFVPRPNPPYAKAEDLLGIFMSKRESGDFSEVAVYRRTADHKGEALFRYLSSKDHTYRDFHLTIKWTYADGISIYTLEASDLPTESRYKFSRDFIVKRDEKGIWSIDTLTGDDLCEVQVDKLELPPPPPGFRAAP
jgi:hypothetical protein